MPLSATNTFQINNSSGSTSLTVDPDDEKTGNKWTIKVDDGKLLIEPVELEDKRDHKIKSILDVNLPKTR